MRVGVLIGLVCFSVFLSLSPAGAARFSGEYLMYVCGRDENGKELVSGGHIACQAYIAGVLDYHNLIRSMGAAPGVDFCVPENVDMYHLQDQVLSYIFRHREQHAKFVASPGVALALYSAYPCKGAKKK